MDNQEKDDEVGLIDETPETPLAQPREIHPGWLVFYGLLGVLSGYFIWVFGIVTAAGMGGYYYLTTARTSTGTKFHEFGMRTRKAGIAIVLGTILIALLRVIFYKFFES